MRQSDLMLPLIVCVCGACGGGGVVVIPEPDDGVPVVELSAEMLAAAPALRLEQEMRINGDAEASSFSNVPGIAVSAMSETFVVDARAANVRVFDASGRLIRQLGGIGDGPGELRVPSLLALAHDTLFVIDFHGLNRFTASGTFIDRIAIHNPPGARIAANGVEHAYFLAHSRIGLLVIFPDHASMRGLPGRDTIRLFMLDPGTGMSSDPISGAAWPEQYRHAGGVSNALFVPDPLFVASEDRACGTRPDGIDVDVFALTTGGPCAFDSVRRGGESRRVPLIRCWPRPRRSSSSCTCRPQTSENEQNSCARCRMPGICPSWAIWLRREGQP